MDRILARAQYVLLGLGIGYLSLLAILTTPFFQNHALYMHAIKMPLFADLTKPEKYGLPVHRSLNLYIDTPDNVRLGAWLTLPKGQYSSEGHRGFLPSDQPSEDVIRESLSTNPTILFFHGNAATRAMSYRARLVTAYSGQFNANVLAIDYRGFGDSSGVPSEEGLIVDAKAAWDWVIERGAKPKDTLLVGLSLGTGVATELGARLSSAETPPCGVILLAPFTTLESLLDDYHLFGFLPILQPLQPFPFMSRLLKKFLNSHFMTINRILDVNARIVIVHSTDDFDIPVTHSRKLFATLLEPLLPPEPSVPQKIFDIGQYNWTSHQRLIDEREAQRVQHVHTQVVEKYGTISSFTRQNGHDVVFVESKYGGHDRIGLQGTIIDVIGSLFNLE